MLRIEYFTRTGTSRSVAEKLGARLSAPVGQIKDSMDWSGFWGYLRAGRYSMMKKKVEIDVEGSIEDGDEIIVVAPFWGGGPACAAKRFAERMSSHRLHLVVTSNMSSPKVVPGFESVATINRKMNVDEAVQAIAARFQK